ncbi:hypothetical protein NIES4071_64470 [Calothrix sp. NIES-4071]|nr:hypothetical protein NIES4071_64470 [Calothrix sp. NIES-4071]BAZ60751.1 hypothetical protein NIES4105_64430 [Calothrix sp. NIES-4105]
MKPSKKQNEPSGEDSQVKEFEQGLYDVESALVALKQRYEQVENDYILQDELKWRRSSLHMSKLPEMKAELKHIEQQLEVLSINLESRLLNWRSFKDPFWQIVRFSGLGVIIGWLLKSFAS